MGANFDLIKWGGFKNDWQPVTGDLPDKDISQVDSSGSLTKAAGGVRPPDDPLTATDELIRQKRAAEMNRLMLGMGRQSTFSQGGMGDLRLGRKALTGGE